MTFARKFGTGDVAAVYIRAKVNVVLHCACVLDVSIIQSEANKYWDHNNDMDSVSISVRYTSSGIT